MISCRTVRRFGSKEEKEWHVFQDAHGGMWYRFYVGWCWPQSGSPDKLRAPTGRAAGAAPATPSGPRRIEILFLGHNSTHHDSARFAPMLKAALAPDGFNFSYTADPAALNCRQSRAVRRVDDLREPHEDRAGTGKGAARLRRRRQGVSADPLGVLLLPEFRAVHLARRGAVPEARHRRVHGRDHAGEPSGDGRHEAVSGVGRNLRPHQDQSGQDRPDGARRRRRPRAVDVGAHARQGPRLLHRVRA